MFYMLYLILAAELESLKVATTADEGESMYSIFYQDVVGQVKALEASLHLEKVFFFTFLYGWFIFANDKQK